MCLEMHASSGGMDASGCQCSAKEKEDHSIFSMQLEGQGAWWHGREKSSIHGPQKKSAERFVI